MDLPNGMTKKEFYQSQNKQLKNDFTSYNAHYRELSEFIIPRHGLFNDNDNKSNRGSKKNGKILNSTATFASQIAGAGMHSGLTNPGEQWFRFVTPDPAMMLFAPVRRWLGDVEMIMGQVFARSNLYKVLPGVYREEAVFGTAAVLTVEDPKTVVRFHQFTAGTYYAANSDRLEVDTLYHHYQLSVGQLVSQFGLDNVSPTVKKLWANKQIHSMVDVIHAIQPNLCRDHTKKDNKNMKWSSDYFEAKCNDNSKMLLESGFNEFPGAVPRWVTVGQDVYGSDCPGMTALGDIKSLMFDERRKGENLAQLTKPTMNAPTSARKERLSLIPGKINYMDIHQGQRGYERVFDIDPRSLQFLGEDIAVIEERINKAFHVDVFQAITQLQTSGRTATEIAERVSEKLSMLGPVTQSQHDELLNPIVDRVFNILVKRGMLPKPPKELEGVNLRVEYISSISLAQKQSGLSSIERYIQFQGSLAQQFPETAMKINALEVMDVYADRLGVDPRITRSDEEVSIMQEQQAALQSMQNATEGVKNLASSNMEGDNALTEIMGAMQGG